MSKERNNISPEQRHKEIQMKAHEIKQKYPHVDDLTAWSRAETIWKYNHSIPGENGSKEAPNAPESAEDR